MPVYLPIAYRALQGRTKDKTMNAILKPQQLQAQISAQERARRQASIDNARGSVRFEGFILSPEVEQINRRFIDGELTGDQHIEAIKAAVLHG